MNITISYDAHTRSVKFASKAIILPLVIVIHLFLQLSAYLEKNFQENSRLYFVIELNKNTSKQYHLDCEGSEMEISVMEIGQYIIPRTKIRIMLSNIKAKKLFHQYFVNLNHYLSVLANVSYQTLAILKTQHF